MDDDDESLYSDEEININDDNNEQQDLEWIITEEDDKNNQFNIFFTQNTLTNEIKTIKDELPPPTEEEWDEIIKNVQEIKEATGENHENTTILKVMIDRKSILKDEIAPKRHSAIKVKENFNNLESSIINVIKDDEYFAQDFLKLSLNNNNDNIQHVDDSDNKMMSSVQLISDKVNVKRDIDVTSMQSALGIDTSNFNTDGWNEDEDVSEITPGNDLNSPKFVIYASLHCEKYSYNYWKTRKQSKDCE